MIISNALLTIAQKSLLVFEFSYILFHVHFTIRPMYQQEFIEYVLYIASRCKGITITKLYKLLWFASIAHADRYGSLLVKDVFLKMPF